MASDCNHIINISDELIYALGGYRILETNEELKSFKVNLYEFLILLDQTKNQSKKIHKIDQHDIYDLLSHKEKLSFVFVLKERNEFKLSNIKYDSKSNSTSIFLKKKIIKLFKKKGVKITEISYKNSLYKNVTVFTID